MPEWWEQYETVTPGLAAAPAPSSFGVTIGTPKPPKEEEPPSGYRWTDASHTALVPITRGPADPTRPGGELDPQKAAKDAKTQEAERTAAYLATNLTANVNILNDALKVDPSAAAPSLKSAAAGVFGETARNYATDPQRQVVYNAQRLITDAALTLGTGAAYTKEQIDAYTRGFFPQLGDSPEAIKAKRESLRAALIAARVKAGSMAPKIDEAMAALGMDANAPLQATPIDKDTTKPQGATAPTGGGVPPDKGGGGGGKVASSLLAKF